MLYGSLQTVKSLIFNLLLLVFGAHVAFGKGVHLCDASPIPWQVLDDEWSTVFRPEAVLVRKAAKDVDGLRPIPIHKVSRVHMGIRPRVFVDERNGCDRMFATTGIYRFFCSANFWRIGPQEGRGFAEEHMVARHELNSVSTTNVFKIHVNFQRFSDLKLLLFSTFSGNGVHDLEFCYHNVWPPSFPKVRLSLKIPPDIITQNQQSNKATCSFSNPFKSLCGTSPLPVLRKSPLIIFALFGILCGFYGCLGVFVCGDVGGSLRRLLAYFALAILGVTVFHLALFFLIGGAR